MALKAGFCFGVKRAIDMARATLDSKEGPIYSLGPLIHNPQVVSCLARMGLKEINDLGEIKEGTLVIRSHGVGPDLLETAREKGLEIVDATCPNVRRAQDLARELSRENIQVVVVGDKEHPEVQGIIGWTCGKAMVAENPEEAAELTAAGPIGVVAQTTQPQENFDAVVDILRKTGAEVRVCNTICNATAERRKPPLILPGRSMLWLW